MRSCWTVHASPYHFRQIIAPPHIAERDPRGPCSRSTGSPDAQPSSRSPDIPRCAAGAPAPATRRTALGLTGLTVLGLAGVGCEGPAGAPRATPTVAASDLAAATDAARSERALLTAYDTAIRRHPSLTEILSTVRAQHADHSRALAAQLPAPASGTTAPAPPAGGTGTTGQATPDRGLGAGTGIPADSPQARASTLAELIRAEQTAAAAHRHACLRATGALAPLLASLCAAESAHADLLARVPAAT
jgi:hypothetical protein